jgi:uncharacterized protein
LTTTSASTSQPVVGRFRQLLRMVLALIYFYVAWRFSVLGAAGLASERWLPLVQSGMLAFLLIIGFAGFGIVFDRQNQPLVAQGLPRRSGFAREFLLGLAVGWTLALAAILPLVFIGGIVTRLHLGISDWFALFADALFFFFFTLVEELVFRGYPFQKFSKAIGPFAAALFFAALYAILQSFIPGATRLSITISFVFSLLLTMAYLRTRALWVSWGLNFAWKASRALLFGLAIAGVNQHSSVVVGDPVGPFWLTGGGFGLDGSWTALLLLLITLPILYRLTRELDFIYNAPVIIPGGYPVDLDAAAKQQHEAAMGPAAPASPSLIQIAPVASSAPAPSPDLPK